VLDAIRFRSYASKGLAELPTMILWETALGAGAVPQAAHRVTHLQVINALCFPQILRLS